MEGTMTDSYLCSFCGLSITPASPDVCSLEITTDFDKAIETQHKQVLFCHAACFQDRIHPSVKLYVLSLASGLEPTEEELRKLPDWLRNA
jgi:hypothetical protein